jgi:plastocyanin
MNRPIASLKFALGLLAAGSLLASAAQADTAVVTQINFNFSPFDITINEGDTVRWIRTSGDHDVTSGTDGTLDGNEIFHGLLDAANPIFEHTFDSAFVAANPMPGGVYDYFCSPHFQFGMVATVTVVSDNTGSALCDGSGGNCPCARVGAVDHGCPNTNANGLGAAIVGSGNAQVSADTFNLTVTDGPANKPGLILRGTADLSPGISTINDCEGLLCVGGQTQRGDVFMTDASGNGDSGGTFQGSSPFGSSANIGGSDYYQYWFRDPGGDCNQNDNGGANFNFTNSWTVTWTP